MGGKMSRDKGARVERELVNLCKEMGIEAMRVPLSGAAEGFKGDVLITLDKVRKCEVKARKDEYKSIYAMFEEFRGNMTVVAASLNDQYFAITSDIKALGFGSEVHVPVRIPDKKNARAMRKVLGLKKLVKECDFLAIKINGKPFLYIRYL